MKGKLFTSTRLLVVLFVILIATLALVWNRCDQLDDAIQEQAEISSPAEENEEEVRRIEAEVIAREIAEEKEALKEVEKVLSEPVEEEVCNPSIEVTKTYRFTSAIGFTFTINNDCNENLSPGKIKFALHNPDGSVYAKKLIDFPVLKPYTHWSTEIIFKTKTNPDFVTYSLQRR